MLALLSLAAAATCPCRQPQDIVIVFDAAGTNSPSLDASVNAVLTALVQELSCSDSATQIALVAFAGSTATCDPYDDCTTVLAGLTSDASTLTAAIAGRGASDGKRCTSCGIETALELLRVGRASAGATVLLLTNGAQTVGGPLDKPVDKSELLVVLPRPTCPTPHPRPDSRRSTDRPRSRLTGIRASRLWGLKTASRLAAKTILS